MKFDKLTEWRNFEAALIKELKDMPIVEFGKVWGSRPAKTRFYGEVLLPKVAKSLGYQEVEGEFLRCDYVILNKDRVPVVFMESENSHTSASNEIDKLCAVSSPIRVLFLCCEWEEGERAKYLPGWQEKFATHHKYSDQNAVYMIVIGEWLRAKPGDDVILKYIIESFDISGKQIGCQKLELSRTKS